MGNGSSFEYLGCLLANKTAKAIVAPVRRCLSHTDATEKTEATRRIRTADLLITKNNNLAANLLHPEKLEKKRGS
jgi:hypothetical protein